MRLTFLKSPISLTKTFTKTDTGIEKSSYPNAYEVTSIDEEAPSLPKFAELITKHAALGHCLLKGNVTRQLSAESRAGSTDPNASSSWALLDVDGLPFNTPEEFMAAIGLGNVSYIVQYSASYKITDTLLRCHVFVLLDKPYPAPLLKQHLIAMNFKYPQLRAALQLTKTGNALRYGLDITTCQNDKLIYIADPVCKGFKAPVTERVALVKKKQSTVSFDDSVSPVVNQALVEAQIAELRKKANLPERKNSYKMVKNVEVLARPDKAIISGMREERGFVYFNLNGGDSWGYYHPLNNPEFIHNFKGEPPYLTKELLPEYWAQVNSREGTRPHQAVSEKSGTMYLAFLDKKSASYWRGTYKPASDELDLYFAKNETQVRHFALQHGFSLPDYIPEWQMIFDPHAEYRVDVETARVNTYQPSEYMKVNKAKGIKGFAKKRVAEQSSGDFPTIRKVIHHVLGNDKAITDHFMNWLACIAQKKDRTLTAWVLHGRTSTGKGVLMNRILAPLFGSRHVAQRRLEEIDAAYNGFMEGTFIVFVDEVQTSTLRNEKGVMAKLKNFITEPVISVRNMYQAPYNARNYTNWIFASNMPDPVSVDVNDRRFNVGRYQGERIDTIITKQEIEEVIGAELQAFCDYLMSYPVDVHQAMTPLQTEDRDKLMSISEASIDSVAKALVEGNFEFFLEHLPTNTPSSPLALDVVDDYKATLLRIIGRAEEGVYHIARDELRALFEWTVGDMPKTPNKFTSRLKHHRIHMKRVRIGAEVVQGISVEWKDLDTSQAKARLSGKPVAVPTKEMKSTPTTKGKTK
jgi:hypothetical protein